MNKSSIVEYPLTDEGVAKLPEPLRIQRDAQLQYIEDYPTEHPLTDNGKSVNHLAHTILKRAIMDEVTRRIFQEDDDDESSNPTDLR